MRCLAVRPSVERCGITGGPCCATSSAMNCAAAWSVGLATTVASPREARYAFTAARSESCSGSAFTAVDCAASAKRTAAKQRPRDSNLTRVPFPVRPMRADRLCHTRPNNSGDKALARRLPGRGGSPLRANLGNDLRDARRTSLRALGGSDPVHEFLAMRKRKRIKTGPQLRCRERAGEVGGNLDSPRGGIDLERDTRPAARHELRLLADLLACGEVVTAAVYSDRGAIVHAVEYHTNRHALSRLQFRDHRLRDLDQNEGPRIRLRDRGEGDRGHERAGVGVFTDSAANAGTGRVNPLSERSPTALVSASPSTAACTRWLSRIWPPFASADRRCARITTFPIAP